MIPTTTSSSISVNARRRPLIWAAPQSWSGKESHRRGPLRNVGAAKKATGAIANPGIT